MHRSHFSLIALSFTGLCLVPSVASATPHSGKAGSKRTARAHSCVKAPVEIVAGAESATFSLAKCDGRATPAGVDELSVLARPGSAPKPTGPLSAHEKTHGTEVAPGIRRIDPRLVERLETVVDHFRKDQKAVKVALVSGYRPRSAASYHSTGRALDFRIEGVENESLVAFCKTMPDTGCGYYPNSLFVHMDVRDAGTGHVSWIDVSRPGDAPKYVDTWPAPGGATDAKDDAKDGASKLRPLPAEDHGATDTPPLSKATRSTSTGLRFF